MQARKELLEYFDDSLVNKLVESKVPEVCKKQPCILGIDEAGRGPVLGPMTYGAAYYPQSLEQTLSEMKFADSKVLTESTRETLFEAIGSEGYTGLGYMIKIISPNMISNSMLRRNKYNLNALSHDTAIDLIKRVQLVGVDIAHVYLDTVGPADKYKAKLKGFFPGIQFTVASKADSLYPIVSAASVCAKVMRDRIVGGWRYLESNKLGLHMYEKGSGYPSDPTTKKYLQDIKDPVFGFPTFARFSWSTVSNILKNDAAACDWNEPDSGDEGGDNPNQKRKQANMMSRFVQKGNKIHSPSPPVFEANKQSPANLFARPGSVGNQGLSKKRTNADAFFEDRQLSKISHWAELDV